MEAISRALINIAFAISVSGVLLSGKADAGPIGPDNYDFATLSTLISWNHAGQFNGWTFATADINGDDLTDILLYVHDSQSWRTWAAVATGAGTFAVPVHWSAPGNWVGWTFQLADANGDGRDDLIVRANDAASWRSRVALSLGNGVFAQPVHWESPGHYGGWTSSLADINADGKTDLLLQAADAVSWRTHAALGIGDGTFAAPVAWSTPGVYTGWNLATGDFNADGRADLLLDHHGGDGWRARVALAIGNGTFATPVAWQASGSFEAWNREHADFNADGRTDLRLSMYDATGWHSRVALATGAGSFGVPVSWTSIAFGTAWTFGVADFNGDGGADLVAQRADSKSWEARVAISLGDGRFIAPRPWGAFDRHFGGWSPVIGDFSGDGRANVLVYAADQSSWRSWSALAQGCDTVIGSDEDFTGRIAELPALPSQQRVCLKPGLYDREILISGKQRLSFIAAHGDATIQTSSFAYVPDAIQGLNPGAPIQIWDSDFIEVDGFIVRNLFTYQLTPDQDQRYMVSRAMEVLGSDNVTLSHLQLIGPGKQLLHTEVSQNVVLQGSALDCYYFCIDTTLSSFEARRTHFRTHHQHAPADDHAMFWSTQSNQRYLNSTMEFVTGVSLFAGVNDFENNLIEVAGETVVSENGYAWVSQHPNYNGFNVRISGVYTALADWYFIPWMPGWQQEAQICYYPTLGQSYCVNHFE